MKRLALILLTGLVSFVGGVVATTTTARTPRVPSAVPYSTFEVHYPDPAGERFRRAAILRVYRTVSPSGEVTERGTARTGSATDDWRIVIDGTTVYAYPEYDHE